MYFDDQSGTTSVENTRRRTFSNGIHRKNDAVRLHVRKIGTREASLRGIQSRGHTVENRCQDGNWFYLRDGKLTRDVSTPLFTCGRPCAQTIYQMSMGILEKIRQMAVKAFEEGIKETNSSHAFLRT